TTLRTIQTVWSLPNIMLGWLFWFGMGSLTIMSLLYLTLALANNRQQHKRLWMRIPDNRLPYVSVVIAAYNEEKVIRKTLDTLRASDYPQSKLEVIVVNDGSKDNTREILNGYAREWLQLQVIHQPNTGKSAAINNGIANARTESGIIVTLDADTLFEPQTIHRLVRHFVKNTHQQNPKPVGAVAGHVKVGNRRNLITAWQSLEYISGICVTRLAESSMNAIAIVPGACSAWNRRALEQIGGLSEDTLAEDADATLQLHQLGYGVLQENTAVAYTEAPESIRALAKQRLRWTFGNIQVLWKHRSMLLRPRYGLLGMVSMPYALLSLIIPLMFLPPTVIAATMSVASGNWSSVVLFAAFVMTLHMIMSIVAIVVAHERPWHLWVVPVYRLIYEPLRAYLLYASLMRILKGGAAKWNKLERLNSAALQTVG
ncbi:MAG: glycosyltransferase family 2 protein, partial [Candidatus Saccharibacteria bacterium]|nr:glycosyltransferase family 2 protein [Candidatus Saccharibacteria bacterium]